ncbi:MAG: hypothetical protein R3B47_09820 [Bacteroidia bacterium]
MFSKATHSEIERLKASIEALDNDIPLKMEDGREVNTPKLHPIDKDGLRYSLQKFLKEINLRKKEIEPLIYAKWLMEKREEAIVGIVESNSNIPSQLFHELILPVLREEIREAEFHKPQSENLKKDITKLILNGQLDAALEMCMEYVSEHAPDHSNEVIHLMSELRHYESQERKKLLDQETVSRARAQIRDAVLDLADLMDNA